MELYAHQKNIIDENKPRLGLFHAPGLGKTITLLELAKKNNVKAIIVCPKGIKKQWQEYVEKYNAPHDVYTKEEFRKYYDEIPRYEAVIIDEVHHFSGQKSMLKKRMLYYLKKHNVHYRWFATGTPYRSSAMNIYVLGILLGYEWNYWRFFSQFFQMVNMGSRMVPVAIKGKEAELEQYVRQIGVTLSMDSVFDVPEQSEAVEYFELTKEQEGAIESLEEMVPISRFTKIHCIENGFLYGDGYTNDATYNSLKTERIMELCEKHKTIAIVARYTLQIDLLNKELGHRYPKRKVFTITGETKDRFKVVNEINSLDNCIVIIQSQCSEGYELPKVEAMVFASLSWSHVDHIQMKARVLRMNALKENSYYYLVTEGVDKKVYKTIMNHQDFHESLFLN